MHTDANKATCRRFIQQIFNGGDLSSIRDFVSADALHHELDGMYVPAGHSSEGLVDMIYVYRLAFPDLQVEIQDQIAESDQVVTRLRIQGTQKGPLLGIGVSGKTVDLTGIRVDRLAEGRITESWFHWAGLGMLRQIGALPNPVRNRQSAQWVKKTIAPTGIEMPRPFAAEVKLVA